nr:PREDICTED: uncharacterized protein LOC100875938 [Megachile rotundata]
MQQASVGGCDGDSRPVKSAKIFGMKGDVANDRSSSDPDARVRVKVEAPESTEMFEMKREPQDQHEYQHDFRYDRKSIVPLKLELNQDIAGQTQQHPGYRAATSGFPNSYGFPHFYGTTMLPPPFPAPVPRQDKIEEQEREQERYRVTSVPGDGDFPHHEPHRFEISDYQTKHPGYPAMPYASFRPSMQPRSSYGGHQNNSSYRNTQYQNRKRKWGGAALRGMHPSIPWPTWFYRPDFPLGTPLPPTNHVSNTSSVPTSSPLSSRCLHSDAPKGSEFLDSSKIHGQTPTICTSIRCTVNGCSCDSFTPGKRHIRYCDRCHHGWVLHALARLSSGGDVVSSPRAVGRDDRSVGGRVKQATPTTTVTTTTTTMTAVAGGGGSQDGGGSVGGGGDVAEKEERPPASESVEPTAAFDVASLVLYGSRALPIRLKILLDQLFNQLQHAQVTRLLAAFGWTYEDYTRGYILQVSPPI